MSTLNVFNKITKVVIGPEIEGVFAVQDAAATLAKKAMPDEMKEILAATTTTEKAAPTSFENYATLGMRVPTITP